MRRGATGSGSGSSASSSTLPSDLPRPQQGRIEIPAGSGFVFSSQSAVRGASDRDIWWNRIGLVPGQSLYSVGTVSSPDAIKTIERSKFAFGEFKPSVGESFIVRSRIPWRAYEVYVLITVESIAADGLSITLSWTYPFVRPAK